MIHHLGQLYTESSTRGPLLASVTHFPATVALETNDPFTTALSLNQILVGWDDVLIVIIQNFNVEFTVTF